MPVDPSPQLLGCVQRPETLTVTQRRRMYELLAAYFQQADFAQFEGDLAEKEWVVLLTDAALGQIQGFSTLMQLSDTVDGQAIVAFYSGDTIIQRDYWGQTELPRIWGRHVFQLAEAMTERAFWFLISSGYKTYRFLPVFFRHFYPSYRQPTPLPIKQILDRLGQRKFPGQYDPGSGLIRFAQPSPLRAGVAEITPARLKNRHIAFFVAANPGHVQGDQLACLVELNRANLTPAGLRMLATSDEWRVASGE